MVPNFSEYLLSPGVIAFILGIFATIFKSDLRLPKELYETLSSYLLIAMGIMSGESLATCGISSFYLMVFISLILAIVLPVIVFFVTKSNKTLNVSDRASLAAHYGATSTITFMMAKSYLDSMSLKISGYVTALMIFFDSIGIMTGLIIYNYTNKEKTNIFFSVKNVIMSKSVYLLLGGLFIGWAGGEKGVDTIRPFFINGFKGALVFFLLEMGAIAGEHIKQIKNDFLPILITGITLPLLTGIIGTSVACLIGGMNAADATAFASLCASASYIAAPSAAIRDMPKANHSFVISSVLVVTFPFNLIIGVPIFYKFAEFLVKISSH